MFDIVTIGASAGGIQTCCEIFNRLPMQFSWPILLVQHLMPSQDSSLIANIIGSKTGIPVTMAKEGEFIQPGRIYIAPSGTHMLVTRKKTLHLSKSKKIMHSRPSIDVLFKSVAHVFCERTIGIILTGANKDGAEGLAAIKKVVDIQLYRIQKLLS